MSQEFTTDEVTLPIKRTEGETIQERLTGNAYHNILPARYLRKDADGELVEQQEELFERVAKNIALAEAVFEADNRGTEITVAPAQLKPDHPRRDELAEEVFGAGVSADDDAETTLTEYNVNKFAYETIVPELPVEIRDHVEAIAREFQDAMEQLSFTPNCVPPDSLVAAGGGMKRLSEVEPGERVYDDEGGDARVKDKYQNGRKRVVKIETESGYSVRATPEHYFRVIDEDGEYEWRQVKDIEPDESLALQKNFLDDEGARPDLRSIQRATDGGAEVAPSVGRSRLRIETPDTVTPELTEWLGLYVGDGTARESGVRVAFPEVDDDLVNHWCELTESIFGFEPTTGRRGDAACVVGRASRRDLYTFLDQNDLLKQSSNTATVPDAVFRSGRNCVARFLRGLFEADGTVGEQAIELYTHSKPLAEEVQNLLLGLGIRASISEKRDGYRVTIRKNASGKRFVDRVGFISERKRERASRFEEVSKNATSVKIPNQTGRLLEWYRESDLGHDTYRDLSQFLIDPESEYHQEIGKRIFERYAETYPELWDSPVAEHVERDQFYERVESVTDVGTMAVEDMQVPRRNTYVVEGFVSHNSPTLMNAGDELQQLSACFVDSPSDDIDDIHQTAKEAAQVFQCLTADTHVYVDGEGVVSIADVEPGDRIVQRDGDTHDVRNVEETHAYDDSPVHRVVTEAGIELTGTPNHELLVDGNWARIDEIEPGETLSLRLGWIDSEDATTELTTVAGGPQLADQRTVSNDDIPELGVSSRTVVRHRQQESLDANGKAVKEVRQPTEFSAELAEVVGMWVGDGSKHEDGIRFHINREEVLERAERLCRDLFDVGLDWRWDDGCYEAVVHSHEVKRWWLANFGDAKPDATTARVPEAVRESDRETIAAFLRGLFSTDGSLQEELYPRLWSPSETLIDEVQQLLLGVGVPATEWEDDADHPEYFTVGPTGERGLEQFLDVVGFVDSRTEQMAERFEAVDSEGPSVGTIDGSTWTVPVETVEDAGTATVYDVTVAEDHEYVASSVVSHNSGGGMGYAFWQLRPYGDPVGSTGGIASGPITFMRTFDQMCETIAQGGARRGAQMGVMRVSHPDVIQFIHAKNKDVSLANTLRLNDPDDFTHTSFADALEEARGLIDDEGRVPEHLRNAVEGHLSNFNISVGVTDQFMAAVKNDEAYTFTNPRTGDPHVATEQTKELYDMFDLGEYVEVGEELSVPAQEIWERIIEGAHENGEPGVIYLERVNKQHSFDVEEHPEHQILATNPCGEQPLEEYEACNLGHINLSTLAAEDGPDWRVWSGEHADEFETEADAIEAFLETAIDWEEFDRRIELGTRFLENVVTMSDFPVDEIEKTVREMRKIGLGIMGLAQLYIQLGMRYGSEPANEVARQLMTHINRESKWTSHELAQERGVFGEWEKSKYANPTEYREWFEHQTGLDADEWVDGFPIRNHNTTTIAPTGCVEEKSLVSTDEGLVPIENLDETTAEFEQWDEIDVGVTTDGGTKTATAVYDNSLADVRRIETKGGFSVAATPNHRFRTVTEDGEYTWKEADDFESGDRIVLQRDTFDGDSHVKLDANEGDNYYWNTDADLQLPREMTPELAEFLGYFMGDGYVHDEVGVKLVVNSDAEELDEYLRDLGQQLFGVTPTVEDRDTRHILAFGGRHLPRYFADNGWKKEDGNEGEGAASAFIPEAVLRGDRAIAKAFLRGLFEADGTASRKVELSTVSSTLAKQVQTLLLSVGCVFVRDTLAMEDREDHYGDRPRHTVRGANRREDKRFTEEIGFIKKSTEFELTAQSYRNDTYPPGVVELLRDLDGYESVSKSTRKRVNQSPINGTVARKLVRDVERETGETARIDGRELTDFYAATIESVTEDTAYTKDISVPSNNTYVANGFVTHNTTSMVGNTTGGCEPIYNVAYYKNVSDDVQGDEMLVEFDDYFLRTLEANDIDVEAVKREAQEQMAENEFRGVEGLSTVPDAIGELFVTTGDLSAKEHAGVQTSCQTGVDSAISKCLEAGTLVQTDSGVRPIESFAAETPEPGEFVDVTEDVTIDGVPVESQYYAGEKDATRVRVDNGTELVGATESHKVLTPDGWETLGNLEEGDYVVGRHTESHGDGNAEISFTRGGSAVADGGSTLAADGADPSVFEKDVTLPSQMSPRLAKFLGMYAADGSAIDRRYSIEISTSSERVRDEACELFEELFEREPSIDVDTRGSDRRDTVYGVHLNSRPVWEFVKTLCGSGSYEKEVPREVLQGSPEEKLAFVNGVTLDGYVTGQSLVVYGGMSRDLADGVAELLRSFGVPKVYVGQKWVDESEAYTYQVHVTNDAQELVRPIEPHKRVDRFDQRYRVYVPQDRVDKTEFDSRSREYYAARNFEYRDRNYMFDTTAENLGITDAPPLYEVTEVEGVGTREMYDIELAGPHEYVVGGVVSHNTVNAPNDSTIEDAKDVFEYIYDHGGKGVTYYRDGTRSKQVLTTRAQNAEFAEMDEGEVVEQIEELFGSIESFVESDAVREALDREIAELLGAADGDSGEYTEKRPRPDVLHGVTQRIDTGYGKLYVNINEDPEADRPFELFANIGNSGGFTASFTEALAKTISTALRSGVDPREIADELQGIRSPKVAWDKGEQIQSIPDAIGTAMQRYLDGDVERAYPQQQTLEETAEAEPAKGDKPDGEEPTRVDHETDGGAVTQQADDDDQQSIIEAGESPECPECGSLSLYYSEGCKTCEACGWSEC